MKGKKSFACVRLPVPQSFRIRRFIFLFAITVCVVYATRLYLRIRTVLQSSCNKGPDWRCQLESIQHSETSEGISDGREPGGKSVPLVAVPKSNASPSLGWEGVYGAISDTLRKPDVKTAWNYLRDANDTSMSRRQCNVAFPRMYGEIWRAKANYYRKIEPADVARIAITDGRVRARIIDGKLYVVRSNLTTESLPRAIAVLESINRAISNPGPYSVPSLDFVFSVDRQIPDITEPLWVFERSRDDTKPWIMPSTGLVFEKQDSLSLQSGILSRGAVDSEQISVDRSGKPLLSSGAYQEENSEKALKALTRDQVAWEVENLERQIPFASKTQRLVGVWRNSKKSQGSRQKALSRVATDQPWAENDESLHADTKLVGIDGADIRKAESKTTGSAPNATVPPLSSMCRFGFLAHDSSFDISAADGPLLCTSVLLTTKPKWIQLYHSLMLANTDNFGAGDADHPVVTDWGVRGASDQNVVVVADDFGDLAFKMKGLMKYPSVAEAIATNSVNTFRNRYLTNAATACYWREMMRAYSSVSYKPGAWADVASRDTGDGWGSWRSRRGVQWENFRGLDDEDQMAVDGAERR